MADQPAPQARSEKRVFVASTFATMLIALAYAEMVQPVKMSITDEGFTFGTSVLVFVFFITTVRVWIGNEMHLRHPSVIAQAGFSWLLDFMFIIVESMLFVFAATTCSITKASAARIGFVKMLLLLYAVDVIWVFTMWFRKLIYRNSSITVPDDIPKWWAVQNSLLIGLIGSCGWWAGNFLHKQYVNSTFA